MALRLMALLAAAAKPHIVLVLADDYGWGNLGLHRREDGAAHELQARAEVHTPHLDGLADEGVVLERHYAYRICSPSRSSLQSGRLAVHVNTVNTGVTVRNLSDPVSGWAGIPRNMTGMAQKLRSAGYRTHMVGKWDAGMATPEHTPLGKGYESWTGYFQHANDYWQKSMSIQSTGEVDNCLNTFMDYFTHNATYRGGVQDGATATEACIREPSVHPECYEEHDFKMQALQVVQRHDASNSAAPLFLFYAFHLLHTPLQVPQSYLEKIDELVAAAGGAKIDTQNRRLYAAMTLYMDEAVADLVKALKAKGMWDNTLFVFTADNGGPIYEPGSANNHPLKGGKYSDWEGGIRVNTFVSGGFVPSQKRGTSFHGIMSIADWYGTFCELAGVDPTDHAAAEANEWLKPRGLPLLHPVDSVPQWGFILNGSNGRPGTLHVSQDTVLRWPYKLVTGRQVFSSWQGELYPNCSTVAGSGDGPVPPETKVFGVPVYMAATPEKLDQVTQVQHCGEGCLFNVEADPSEHHDLASDAAHASTLADLQSELKRLNKGLFSPGRGTPTLAACEMGIENGGFYGPFVDVEGWYTPQAKTPGEAQKDKMLRKLLATANSDIVQQGVAQAAQKLTPEIRDWWMHSLDKCLVTGEQEKRPQAPSIVV